jgi:hypothetical protein
MCHCFAHTSHGGEFEGTAFCPSQLFHVLQELIHLSTMSVSNALIIIKYTAPLPHMDEKSRYKRPK